MMKSQFNLVNLLYCFYRTMEKHNDFVYNNTTNYLEAFV